MSASSRGAFAQTASMLTRPRQNILRQHDLTQVSRDSLGKFIQALRTFNCGLPISRLPNEILAAIFEEAVQEEQGQIAYESLGIWSSGRPNSVEMNLTISHVCYRWRTVAFATPWLWHAIRADVNSHPDRLRFVLERSHSTHIYLDVNFFYAGEEDDEIWAMLNTALRHATHARTLKVDFGASTFSRINWPIIPTPVVSLEIRRSLEDLCFGTFPPLDISTVYPQLREFLGYSIDDIAEWTAGQRR